MSTVHGRACLAGTGAARDEQERDRAGDAESSDQGQSR
jgi:hypothetical protein